METEPGDAEQPLNLVGAEAPGGECAALRADTVSALFLHGGDRALWEAAVFAGHAALTANKGFQGEHVADPVGDVSRDGIGDLAGAAGFHFPVVEGQRSSLIRSKGRGRLVVQPCVFGVELFHGALIGHGFPFRPARRAVSERSCAGRVSRRAGRCIPARTRMTGIPG